MNPDRANAPLHGKRIRVCGKGGNDALTLLQGCKIRHYGQGRDGPAEKVVRDCWLILDKIGSQDVEALLMDRLGELNERVLGVLPYDQELIVAGLSGHALGDCASLREVGRIMDTLEQRVARQPLLPEQTKSSQRV